MLELGPGEITEPENRSQALKPNGLMPIVLYHVNGSYMNIFTNDSNKRNFYLRIGVSMKYRKNM